MVTKPVPLRIEDELLERLERIASVMSERSANVPVSRAAVIRAALERGTEMLESDFGLARKPRRKK